MHTSKTPSLKPLQEAIQKASNMAGENSLKETQKCKVSNFALILCVWSNLQSLSAEILNTNCLIC